MKKIGRFHVLTDTDLQKKFSHSELAAMAIKGGADTIQFRQKEGSTRELIETASVMKKICEKERVPLIINDRIDISIAVDADGVHLGQDDFPISLAREILGEDKIIGGSAGDLKEAKKCLVDGADYIGFGPVYTTASKEDAGPATGILKMKRVIEEIHLPFIGIGGIEAQNVRELMEAGVHGIAVISAVCCRENPELAAREIREAMGRGV
jgi:thiamine-phosphate pyrophosphorylase